MSYLRPVPRPARLLVAMALVGPVAGAGLAVLPAGASPPSCGAGSVVVTRLSGPVLYLETGTSPALDSAYAMYRLTNDSGAAYGDLWAEIGSFDGPAIGLASHESGRAHPGGLADGASANAAFYLSADAEDLSAESHTVSVYSTRPDLAGAPLCTATFTMTAAEDIAASANKVTSVSSSGTPQLGGEVTVTVVGDTGTIGAAGLFTATPASYATWPANAYRLTGSTITMSGGNTGVFTDSLFFSGLNSSATDYTALFTFAVVGTTAASTAVSPMTHISSGVQVKHTSTNNFGTLPAIPAAVNHTTLSLSGSPSTLPTSGGTVTYTVTLSNDGSVPVRLDDLTITLPSGTTYVPGSATYDGDPIGDPDLSGDTATVLTELTVPAGAARDLTLQVDVPGTQGTYTAGAVGHVGTVEIDTTTGTGDSEPATDDVVVPGPPPTVTAVNPANGSASGGTSVTVTGTNFTGATAVDFGATPATAFTVVDANTITATSPAGSGAVDITVTTPGGTSTTGSQDLFTYDPPAGPPDPPDPADLTSTGVGTAVQSVVVSVPTGGSVTLLGPGGAPTAGPVLVAGQGSYTLDGDTITFTPVYGFAGTATAVAYRVTDSYDQSGDATYTPTVTTPAGPTASPLTSTGVGTARQAVTVAAPTGGSLRLLDAGGAPVTTRTVAGRGTFAVVASGLEFRPLAGFTGTAASGYRITDGYGQSAANTYTATVTLPPPPTAPDRTSIGTGTTPQGSTLPIPPGGDIKLLTDDDEPVDSLTVPEVGTYTLTVTVPASAVSGLRPRAGRATTTAAVGPRPRAWRTRATTVAGQHPGRARATTVAGQHAGRATTTARATTTEMVTTEMAGPRRPTGLAQAGSVGAAASAGSATVTFVAALGYAGTPPPVRYRVTDAYGQTATARYTPTVIIPSLSPPPPQSSTGGQTDPQHAVLPIPPGGSVMLLDADGNLTTTVTIPGQGTYTLDPRTGEVTFVPLPDFTGQPDPVRYQITDAYGQTAVATYTPEVVGQAELPVTGAALRWLVAAALLLVLAGAGTRVIAGRPHR